MLLKRACLGVVILLLPPPHPPARACECTSTEQLGRRRKCCLSEIPCVFLAQPEQYFLRGGQEAERKERGLRQQLVRTQLPADRGHQELQGHVERRGLSEQGEVESTGL